MNELLSWSNLQTSSSFDMEDISEQDIPDKPGAYILTGNIEYPYPWSKERGKSCVFYIGKADSLRRRIRVHKKHHDDIRSGNPKYEYYFPIYEYAYYHHCKICWITCDSKQTAKETERSLLEDFANYYGARPVANGQSAWPRLNI